MPSSRPLRFETLEGRQMLATLDLPWPAPQRLTLSFAPDGTRIGHFESDLYSLLGRNRAADEWQTQVLRAFQTWAAVANIDIGLVPDNGQAFGAAGLAQGDPRFGDIRLAAFPQQHALANAVPYLPMAGSWSGDVFLNSAADVGVSHSGVDLFTVLLNEAGNVLGLMDNLDPASVMHTDYIGPRAGLVLSDIDAIRGLYGSRRPDLWEGSIGNDSVQTAAALGSLSSLTGTAGVLIRAELSAIGDVDHYAFRTPDALGNVIVRLRAAGSSLLMPRVSVIDEAGSIIASAAAEGPFDNDVDVSVRRPRDGRSYIVRVEGATNDVFAVGRYDLEVDSHVPAATPAAASAPSSPDERWATLGYVDDELGENDALATATSLTTAWGYVSGTRYEAVGTVRTTTDVDNYRVVSPADEASTALVHVETLGIHPISVQVEVRTAAGDLIGSGTITSGDGADPIEIVNLSPGDSYFVSVTSDGRGRDVGNYVLVVDFLKSDPAVELIASGMLSAEESYQSRNFVIPRTQLFRFDLSADSQGDAGDGRVELAIFDVEDRPVALATASDGQTQRVYVWLTTGAYRFRFSRWEGTIGNSMSYELRGAALSDDTGPGWIDPTEAPLPGDADQNGTVDRGDVRVVASQFTQFSDALINAADFDADGDVDLADLAVVMWNLGRSLLPTSTSQPIPSWASAAVGNASGPLPPEARTLRAVDRRHRRTSEATNLQTAGVVLHSSVARNHRPEPGHQLHTRQTQSAVRTSTRLVRLASVDRAFMAIADDER